MNPVIHLSNGREMTPADFVQMLLKLRKTSSKREIFDILMIENKFTPEDMKTFSKLLKGLLLHWDDLA